MNKLLTIKSPKIKQIYLSISYIKLLGYNNIGS